MKSNAQYSSLGYNDFINLKNTTLKVVLDEGSTKYNSVLKEAMDKYWTYCKYEFLSPSEYQKIKTENFYFLIKYSVTIGNTVMSNDIGILQGRKDNSDFYSLVSYELRRDEDCSYYLLNLIQNMQNHFLFAINNSDKTKGVEPYKLIDFYAANYNKSSTTLIDKTLFILSDDLSKSVTEDKIKSVYPYKFKIVSKEEIESAVTSQDENICYAINEGVFFSVIEAKGGNTIYYTYDNKFILLIPKLGNLTKKIIETKGK